MQQPAIILAAGRGARLGALTAATPKALLRLGPATLLERRLDSLARVLPGTTAHVITGYCAEAFAPYGARPGVVLHPFEEAALANNIVSLLLALETVGTEAGFYLFNSDVVCDDAVLAALRDCPAPDALVIDPASTDAEAMKVTGGAPDGRRLTAIAKTLPPEPALGEYIGLARFSPEGAALLLGHLRRLVREERRTSDWYEAAIDALFADRDVRACLLPAGTRWAEIDTPVDLAHAERLFAADA